MIGVSIKPDIDALVRAQQKFQRMAERRLLVESDRAAEEGKNEIRDEMSAARLGRLGNALGHTSDLKLGKGVHRSGGVTTASGIIFVRSGSERTRGTIDAYTQGATIRGKNGGWMWIPSDDLAARAGGRRGRKMTPALYNRFGFDKKLGPLVRIQGATGPLLIVKNVSINAAGKSRSAKSLTKKGLARKGQVAVDYIVAFTGIKETSRQARVNPRAVASRAAMRMAKRLQG